jgi:predicted nucleic acid-binding Zn ribbon protein
MDVFHSMSEAPRVKCTACGSARTKRLLGTGAGIIFKGSGFYETDYKNGRSKEKAAEKTPAKDEGASKTEGARTSESGSKSKATGKTKPDGGKAA